VSPSTWKLPRVGGVLSRVKVTAVPVKVLPAMSVAGAWFGELAWVWGAPVGSGGLVVPGGAGLPVVGGVVAAGWKTAFGQPEPFQYKPSLTRCSVKVVLLALRPTPPVLSATLPLKLVGTLLRAPVMAVYERLPAGVVTVAVAGAVLSRMKVTAVPLKVLPAR